MGISTKKILLLFTLIAFLIGLNLLKSGSLQEEETNPALKVLLSSIVVDEQARFHPLLRSGTYNPLPNELLQKLDAYLIVNSQTGSVYTAKNATSKIYPASLTKLMTAMVALDVSDPSDKLLSSGRAATQEPTHLGIKPGEVFTIEELIPAMIMTSANDAATVIGEEVLRPYNLDESAFISLMNRKAELLGLANTHFTNTQGFDDENQFSNAYDLVKIAKYAHQQYPLIRESAATPYAALEKNQDHGFYHLPNWNALLGTYPGVDGLKIGYTEKAGYNTIVTAARDGTSLIVVVLGAKDIISRELSAAALLNYAFEKEGEKGVIISPSLIQPRLDEWQDLREKIFDELGIESKEEYLRKQEEDIGLPIED